MSSDERRPSTADANLPPADATTEELHAWASTAREIAAQACEEFEVRAEILRRRRTSIDRNGLRSFRDSRTIGTCVRVWVDDTAGFASTHEASQEAIEETVEEARRIAKVNARRGVQTGPYAPDGSDVTKSRPDIDRSALAAEEDEIVDVLGRVVDGADEEDPRYIRGFLTGQRRRVVYRDAVGREADTTFEVATIQCQAAQKAGDRLADGSAYVGGERGLEDFGGEDAPEEIGTEAARLAEEQARAEPAPAGRHTVLCDNDLSGVMAHESFGHLIEHDVVDSNWSLLAGHQGERFADEGVSVVDAPTAPGAPKDGIRLPYDEEGTEGRPVRILDDGVLQSWLHTRGSAAETGAEPRGNARALNVRHPPIVRMRNTYFEPGDMTVEEAIEELGDGVYLVGNRGGAPASDGTFMFGCKKGYLVEDGEIQHPLRSTSVSGHILDFLENVEGLTQDFDMKTTNFGGCGKWGQSLLPVGTGGPHVLVGEALLGGQG